MTRVPNRSSTIAEARRLYAEGLSTQAIANRLEVSKSTAYRMLGSVGGVPSCLRCGRPRPHANKRVGPLCWTCREAIPREAACRMVISPWQTLPDGTLMRTVTGI
jgi:hypothetical protein